MNNIEFKFRAWNQFEKCFYTKPFLISYTGLPFIYNEEHRHIEDFDVVNPAMGLIIQQYTGLKDKNGKKIYEGDILSSRQANFPVNTNYEIFIAEVKFGNGRFYANFRSGLYEIVDLLAEQYTDLEIVGNVFENPELLK
jgi:uncharacterized phage protein (TIGR01671 family)